MRVLKGPDYGYLSDTALTLVIDDLTDGHDLGYI